MTTTTRQNNLILNQDWTRIYQTFKNADFKSYDFENLRRVIITYLRENYPEDFNDYIESSEYMALIDAVAFLGQSLAFRVDLASRENFIELAERRESVLRIARMLSYNAKRNISSKGLLKFTTVTTTEDILDSNGRNLANQLVSWNDPTNANWAEQFILVLNAAMANNTEFGRSQGSAIIQGIPTEQYRFRTTSSDVPIYSFSKNVAGRNMVFELISTTFRNSDDIYEEPPTPGNQLGFIYKNDSRGPASPNTGFFLMFKQGSLELADFGISVPTTNERIAVDSVNINNDDIWLFNLNSLGLQSDLWTQVSNLTGNNIAYNSLAQNLRNIYAVQTKEGDRIDLAFADGVYGNLPQGAFRLYYRVSNGLTYTIAPNELRGINISIPYVNSRGVQHTLTVGLALQYTVANSSSAESIDSVRQRAPAAYYTQNRMITGEDYNLAPLTSSQDILKVKSINRTSSGISRNFEIIDASGKYSSVNVFADDGFIYRQENERILNFKFTNRIDIINFLRRTVEPAIADTGLYNFYITKFDKKLLRGSEITWNTITSDINLSTGNFVKTNFLERIGSFTESNLKYAVPGSLIKFVPPEGKAFKGNKIVDLDVRDPDQRTKIWAKIIRVVGDGTTLLPSGQGPIFVNEVIPSDENYQPFADTIIPKFVSDLPLPIENEITNQLFQNRNFGIRYDIDSASWKIVTSGNLNLVSDFTLEKSGDTTNNNLDASWLVSFVKDVDQYIVTVRNIDYVFGSKEQNRFYFDSNEKSYNEQTGLVGKDIVKILGVNTVPNLGMSINRDIDFEIDDTIKYNDGYESSREIKVAFSDRDSDGVIDDPEAFNDISGDELFFRGNWDSTVIYNKGDLVRVGLVDYASKIDNNQGNDPRTSVDHWEQTTNTFIFFEEVITDDGTSEFQITDQNILISRREAETNINEYNDGDLVYFYDINENRVKRADKSTNTWVLESKYRGNKGRKNLKFQYTHNASVDRRIDPSASNIIDVFLLTRSYDQQYRQFLRGAIQRPPELPTSDSLRISFGSKLGSIKAISDEIIYHPVKYKVLFGQTADDKLRAQFKIVKNPNRAINDNDLKVRIINAINDFFDVANWDFGDRFYLGELITYIVNSVAPDISNMVILPRQPNQSFGSLFEIQSAADEIFVSGATVDDIVIVSAINAAEVRADPATIVNVT